MACKTLEYYIGASSFIWERDPTKISVGILGIFSIDEFNCWVFTAYQIQFNGKKISESKLQPLWYFSETVMSIGMVGTLIGFLVVLTTTFVDIDTSSTQEMKRVIGDIGIRYGDCPADVVMWIGLFYSVEIRVGIYWMQKMRKYSSNLAFVDLLFNLLVGFTSLLLLAFLLINPDCRRRAK